MKTHIVYEWSKEGIHYYFDGYGTTDIWSKDFAPKLNDLHSHDDMVSKIEEIHDTRLCLIRYRINDEEWIIERSYCYAQAHESGGFLPEEFEDGYKVPKKFHKEFDSWKKTQNK